MVMIGNTDKPIEQFSSDEFNIMPYIEGLGEFIRECQTPMTVAVQGNWGCGKTSMMNMVRDKLRQDGGIIDIWFNTWQYSQFNMDNQLIITFLQHMIKKLKGSLPSDESGKGAAFKSAAKILKSLSRDMTVGFVKTYGGEELGEVAATYLGSDAEEQDQAEQILELKEAFQKLISEAAGRQGSRVVIFIDDLDRLQPMRAVELLEVLKLFVDCENCVFVLAIDTSVVFQGIREKYGRDINDEKAQSFFDKMIQLPFKMPVAYYKLDGLIIKLLDFLREDLVTPQERDEYIRLIRTTAEGNPRSIKRVVNSFLLTDKVAESKGLYAELPPLKMQSRKILLALSCLQLKYEPLYDFILKDISVVTVRRLLQIPISTASTSEQFIKKLTEAGAPEIRTEDKEAFYSLASFFIASCKNFSDSLVRSGSYSESMSYEKLIHILSLTDLTDGTPDTLSENSVSIGHSAALVSNASSAVSAAAAFSCGSVVSAPAVAAPAVPGPADNQMVVTMAEWCEGLILSGHGMRVYRKLMDLHVYPSINTSMKNDPEMKEYANQIIKPMEFGPFNRIYSALKDFYIVEPNDKETSFKFCLNTDSDKYTDCFMTLSFDSDGNKLADVSIKDPNRYNLGSPYYDAFQSFITNVRDCIRELQITYSMLLFKEIDLDFACDFEEIVEEGKLIGYRSCYFGIYCDRIADAVIDFMQLLVSDKDMFYRWFAPMRLQGSSYKSLEQNETRTRSEQILQRTQLL